MENEIDKLPERPNCPTLLTLLLQSNQKLSTIHESFFDHIRGLYLRFCFKLRTLPPEIGKLARLEALDVRWTRIYSWPDEIGQLTRLKVLQASLSWDVVDNKEDVMISGSIISRCLNWSN